LALRLIILCFACVLAFGAIGQSKEFEKLRVFFRQHRFQPISRDSVMIEHTEIVWITLTIKDSLVISTVAAFKDQSSYKNQILAFLNDKMKGYKFGNTMAPQIVIPLMVGYFSNRNFSSVKQEWESIETLRTVDLENNASRTRVWIFPIYNVLGTLSPPKKVRIN
jgi:hypothetical protein